MTATEKPSKSFLLLVTLIFLALNQSLFAVPMLNPTARTVMVHLFEWPWPDIARECEEYLGPKGFAAVQISPPQEHIITGNNFWWERYQPVSYKLASRSGGQNEFADMVRRCRQAGIAIYVDLVINHMAQQAQGTGTGGTHFKKYDHPGLYSFQDFNHCGRNGNDEMKNFNDRYEVQYCELLGLADLKTSSEYVQNQIADYMRHLMSLGVQGFRVDAAKHIPAADLGRIVSKVPSDAYVISETFIGIGEPVKLEEYTGFSDVNVFQYSFQIGNLFRENKLNQLPWMFGSMPDSMSAVVFVENHDLQRMDSSSILSYWKSPQEYLLANVFLLTWPYGYPQIFSGYSFTSFDQGPPMNEAGKIRSVFAGKSCEAPWICEHRLPGMAALVNFRNVTSGNFIATDVWTMHSTRIAFGRGHLGFVVINNDNFELNETLKTSMADGVYCNILEANYQTGQTGQPGQSGKACQNGYEIKGGYLKIKLAKKSAVVLQADTQALTRLSSPMQIPRRASR